MSSGTREDFTGPPDPEPCSCDEALGLKEKLVAALARAAAAERGKHSAITRLGTLEQQHRSAESSLAEVTALLDDIRDVVFDTDFSPSHGKSSRIEKLERMLRLPADPAPAAPVRRGDSNPAAYGFEPDMPVEFCDGSCANGSPCPAPAAESEADTTVAGAACAIIALRECRAELEIQTRSAGYYQRALESARAERDAALAERNRLEHDVDALSKYCLQQSLEYARNPDVHSTFKELQERSWAIVSLTGKARVQSDLTAALARIAELEASGFSWESDYRKLEDATKALEDRIARAVAELRGLTVMNSQDAGQVVDASSVEDIARALEALR